MESEVPDTSEFTRHRHHRHGKRQKQETALPSNETTKASKNEVVGYASSYKPISLVGLVQENAVLVGFYS